MPTTGRILFNRLHDALASLRLAVTVMLTLGTTCLLATLYESKHGTAAVQRDVYRTEWFAGILALLGLNIFCSMMKRYPWKGHHTGFVMAHVGILLLLAGSLFSLHFGMDGNMALFEGETTDRVALLDKAMQVAGTGVGAVVLPDDLERRPPSPARERRIRIAKSGITLVAEDFHPHVEVRESFEEDAAGAPALHFALDNPFAKQDGWLSLSDAQRSHLDLGPASLGLHAVQSDDEPLTHGGGNQIGFGLGPSGRVRYAIVSRGGSSSQGDVVIGQAIETPWMGMKIVVDKVLPRARLRREVAPAPPPDKDERRQPAVRVRLESAQGRSASEWVPWTEARDLSLFGRPVRVAYRAPEVSVPFKVTLVDFNSDKYPGSNMPATYESWVRVDDPEKGVSEHHISMNQPLHYRGYIFFQASFVEGDPMMSIFSVARSPGLPLVYLGTTLVAAGVVWMFYVKPALARRQAARALAARRERETRNEAAEPSRPLPSPGPAEPAAGGA